MKLGHIFLILIYASSFVVGITISKDIVYPENNQVQAMSISRISNSIANSVADSIGMNEFFRQLNKGM